MTADFITGVYKLATHMKKPPTLTEVSFSRDWTENILQAVHKGKGSRGKFGWSSTILSLISTMFLV